MEKISRIYGEALVDGESVYFGVRSQKLLELSLDWRKPWRALQVTYSGGL